MAQPLPLPGIGHRPERGQQSCRCGRNIDDVIEVELVVKHRGVRG
jgi:hypothetical protein